MPEDSQPPDPVQTGDWAFLPPAIPGPPQFVEIPGVIRKHKAMFWGLLGAVVLIFLFTAVAVAKAAQPQSVVVFLTQNTREVRAALKALGYGGKRLGLLPVVTVGPVGIELRRSTRPGAACTTLPGGNISHIHPCHFIIFNGRRRFPVLTMMVFDSSGGQLVEIPLPIMGRNGLMFAYPDYANFLLGAVARYCKVA